MKTTITITITITTTTIIIVIVTFPAHDELGTCGASLIDTMRSSVCDALCNLLVFSPCHQGRGSAVDAVSLL